MPAAPEAPAVTVRVPAKVNVQLAVGPPGPDGFHELANVFLAVALHDDVTAAPAPPGTGIRLACEGPDADAVPLDDSNLAARAAALLAAHHGLPTPDVDLHIAKDIPVAGGMAGGSADAAGALLACDALWGTATPAEELHALASRLGSDVPFCLLGGAALGQGRGERLTPLPVAGTFHWVFAVADGGLSTPAVYRECDRLRAAAEPAGQPAAEPAAGAAHEPRPDPVLLAALRDGDAAALAARLPAANDLQPAALSLRPALADTLAAGRAAGALAGLVSGSGPTCAFLVADADAARAVAARLADSGTCRSARVTTAPAPGPTTIGTHA
ncbi:4-(cytidine 5'-diphospho)-2-C-methyl-D-erythritol kinase [Streptomyces sp. 4N509B]|uniref:4-(cytidine 5'-diphospho)-2-C-methyl-D-erythritol kinase n=1 Tax=Streptomyces sp. 4N509B TaxID=3457413 RepID=UPI003FD5C523